MILPALEVRELEKLSELLTEPALREAASFLARLVNEPGFLETGILPLLKEVQRAGDWYVAHRHDGEDGSYSLQTFVWPPDARYQDPRSQLLGSLLLRRRNLARRALRAPR